MKELFGPAEWDRLKESLPQQSEMGAFGSEMLGGRN
jgi:hypothetical protein